MRLFPRFFFALFVLFLVYLYSFPLGFCYVAFSCWLLAVLSVRETERERESEREREREGECVRERERERECLCVCGRDIKRENAFSCCSLFYR